MNATSTHLRRRPPCGPKASAGPLLAGPVPVHGGRQPVEPGAGPGQPPAGVCGRDAAQKPHRHQLRLFLRRQGHPERLTHRPAHRDCRPGASLHEVLPDPLHRTGNPAYGVAKASRIQFNKEWE